MSNVSLYLLYAVRDGRSDAGHKWVDGKDRDDDQWDRDDNREPEQRRSAKHTYSRLVLRV